MNRIQCLKKLAKQFGVSKIGDEVLNNKKFSEWSASSDNKHHCETGGLLRHTYEVVTLCLNTNEFFRGNSEPLDDRILFLSALFHDIGKIHDYNLPPVHQKQVWIKTNHAREVHHVSRSAIMWCEAVEKTGQCKDIKDAVLHCILSHHGRREWGSPVAPHTKEAWMLHLCDGISARMDDCERIDVLKLDTDNDSV